jgi:ABC-2 type transport system permease protein
MNFNRVFAVVIRHLYAYRKNLDRLSDSFYWPTMDIVVWGLTSKWVASSQSNIPHFVLVLLTALVFWQVVWRANYEISVNLLEELWSQNLVNLFSSPLTIYEWIVAVMLIGFVKMLLTISFCAVVIFVLYALNIFAVGWLMLPFLACLLMSGWIMGFMGAAFIVVWGQKVQTMAWTMGFLFAPFSAVYYPLSVLPKQVQFVSQFLPTTYIFEGMRALLFKGEFPLLMLEKSLALNVIYLILALHFFVFMFKKSRDKGLARLE